ncbi:LOW QUALITY PROTEIN: hypothetical protein Cgig2_034084 [Carnegiea gigantea]|uniref:Uncharacterized protein n=1 Tax=Carnegiea gigantea TaxID=171969 RepID=A0A9Q1K1C6_9CARY|nr:LOW QUALITY PROTEIN: hypothetical protein Cgig2_034084 [Carnegiea gigantea]
MQVEEELSKKIPAKIRNNRRNNNQNRDKKASSPKEVHAVNHIIEYTRIRTTYTLALEWLQAKGKINLCKIKLDTKSIKYFDPSKYYKYHQSRGHDTEDFWTLKNRLEKMFKSKQLLLYKAAQKPNNDMNALGNQENIFVVEDQEKEWNPSMFIQDFSSQSQA